MIGFLFLIVGLHVSIGQEPVCSKFSYEQSLLEKMIRTEIKFEQLQNEFKTMLGKFHTTMETIQNTLDDIKTERQLSRDAWKVMNHTLISEVDSLIKNSKKMFTEKERILERLSDDIRSMSTELLSNLTDTAVTPIVAFKATGLQTNSPKGGDILVFPNLLLNLQDGYDSSTGIFTAPVSGLYLFTVQICTGMKKYTTVEIIVGGKTLGQGYTSDYNDRTCNTADAIGQLSVGGTSYIKVFVASTTDGLYHDSHRIVSFSGALLNKA